MGRRSPGPSGSMFQQGNGQPRYVLAGAAGTTPLVSMRMLDRHNLNIDVEDAGRVVIQAKE